MKKLTLLTLLLMMMTLSFAQDENINHQMKIEMHDAVSSVFGPKSFKNYYLVGKLKPLRSKTLFHGSRLHQMIIDTTFECTPFKKLELKERGYCSVKLTKSFRKGSRWVAIIDKESECFCGDAVVY